jgi:diaminopimelate decarboxylase
LKCNSVAGVVRTIFEEGFGAEVMSDYEFWLARRLGMPADRVLLNGPNKSDALLRHAVREGIGAVVVDSIPELERLDSTANECRAAVQVLLRVNPDFVPRGMNSASATGCR